DRARSTAALAAASSPRVPRQSSHAATRGAPEATLTHSKCAASNTAIAMLEEICKVSHRGTEAQRCWILVLLRASVPPCEILHAGHSLYSVYFVIRVQCFHGLSFLAQPG